MHSLDGEAVVQRHRAERGIPHGPPVLVPEHDGLGIVKDHAERDAPAGLEARQQTPDQGLDPLIGHQHHVHPAGVLQAVGREVHHAARVVGQPDAHLAEVELREFAGHALEADQQVRRQRRPHLGEQPVQRTQPERSALVAQPPPHLTRGQARLLGEQRGHPLPDGVRHARAADPRPRGPRARHRSLTLDPPDGPPRHAQLAGHRAERQPGLQQLLYRMAIQHAEHPPRASVVGRAPDWRRQRTLGCPGGGQNLEKNGVRIQRTHTWNVRWDP